MGIEAEALTNDQHINDVAVGQRMVIGSIVLNVATIFTRGVADLWILLGIAAIGLGATGLLRMAGGLGYSTGKKIGLVILVAIPVVGLITLALVNGKATQALRASGYKVGLLGARRS